MVDLNSLHKRFRAELDLAISECIDNSVFIGGDPIYKLEESVSKFLGVNHVISCGNGTDALQIALMSLNLKQGDEVILPSFAYAAVAEVVCLLINAITERTKVIIPAHLFGQPCKMDTIMELSEEYDLTVIEDNAQSFGASYLNNTKAGTVGHIGCTSFFPTKNLGCFGDGGAIFTNNSDLAKSIRMICHHGQSKKYFHDIIGVNSRLDSIQASILDVKLNHIKELFSKKNKIGEYYNKRLANIEGLQIPIKSDFTSHCYHQYTLKVKDNKRDQLQIFLGANNIESKIYYPLPLHLQNAYKKFHSGQRLHVSEQLSKEVLSIPIHSELTEVHLEYICSRIGEFFNR